MIQAIVAGDSLSPQGIRLTSMLITFPRIILSELNTHRMLSKNSASSRAIPTSKLLKMVEENPFVPIAWQKEHKGMQGTEYLSDSDARLFEDSNEVEHYTKTSVGYAIQSWLHARDAAIKYVEELKDTGCTKQIANRLLEPFMWHTVLISGTEWENFFELRCPQYEVTLGITRQLKWFRSRKDLVTAAGGNSYPKSFEEMTELDWLKLNKGQAEIHMMALAEAIWDAMNESKPKQLQAGEWHIPFEDKIVELLTQVGSGCNSVKEEWRMDKVKVSTAMAARTSYTVVGDEKEVSYETLLGIHDKMAVQVPFHASPFEHCARAMNQNEWETFFKGQAKDYNIGLGKLLIHDKNSSTAGWCRNYRGFIQYRHLIEANKEGT